MFRKFLLIGSFIAAPAFAFAGEGNVQTITVQPGQGHVVTVTIPTAQEQPAYALAGKEVNPPVQLRAVRFGQGGLTWIPEAR